MSGKKNRRRSRRGHDSDVKEKEKRRTMDRARNRQAKRQGVDLLETKNDNS